MSGKTLRGGPLKVFTYLTAEKAAEYRAIMRVFTEAKARFALHLRPQEMVAALAKGGAAATIDLAGVETSLSQLCDWGNIEAHADTADVATVEEFYRRETAASAAEEVQVRFQNLSRRARQSARSAGLEREHDDAIEPLSLHAISGLSVLADARRSLDEAVARLRKAARHLRTLNQAVERTNLALTSAKQAQTALTGQLDEALEHQRQAHAAVAEASIRLLNAYRAWVQRLSELSPAGSDEIVEALAD